MIRRVQPIYLLYVLLAVALAITVWSFLASEQFRRNTDNTLSQTYEIQWRSTQIRERVARSAGYLRLAQATGDVDPQLTRQIQLIGINVHQLLELQYAPKFLNEAEIARLREIEDIVENTIAPIVANHGDFAKAVDHIDHIDENMFIVSGAAVAHAQTLNKTGQINIDAARNRLVFGFAVMLSVLAIIVALQRSQFAYRRDQQLRNFASLFAHMTRSRISGLRLFTNMLAKDEPPLPDMVTAARDAISELEHINESLHRIAQAEIDPNTAPLGRIIDNVADFRDIPVSIDIDSPTQGIAVPATPVKLILDELVNNAVTAIGSNKSGKINIKAKVLKRPFPFKNQLQILVEDNGGGMEPNVRNQATNPFFSTRAGTHVGLGLTSCAEMIKTMQGKLAIQSTPRVGTAITIMLPIPKLISIGRPEQQRSPQNPAGKAASRPAS